MALLWIRNARCQRAGSPPVGIVCAEARPEKSVNATSAKQRTVFFIGEMKEVFLSLAVFG
jgi:hypothetical protein